MSRITSDLTTSHFTFSRSKRSLSSQVKNDFLILLKQLFEKYHADVGERSGGTDILFNGISNLYESEENLKIFFYQAYSYEMRHNSYSNFPKKGEFKAELAGLWANLLARNTGELMPNYLLVKAIQELATLNLSAVSSPLLYEHLIIHLAQEALKLEFKESQIVDIYAAFLKLEVFSFEGWGEDQAVFDQVIVRLAQQACNLTNFSPKDVADIYNFLTKYPRVEIEKNKQIFIEFIQFLQFLPLRVDSISYLPNTQAAASVLSDLPALAYLFGENYPLTRLLKHSVDAFVFDYWECGAENVVCIENNNWRAVGLKYFVEVIKLKMRMISDVDLEALKKYVDNKIPKLLNQSLHLHLSQMNKQRLLEAISSLQELGFISKEAVDVNNFITALRENDTPTKDTEQARRKLPAKKEKIFLIKQGMVDAIEKNPELFSAIPASSIDSYIHYLENSKEMDSFNEDFIEKRLLPLVSRIPSNENEKYALLNLGKSLFSYRVNTIMSELDRKKIPEQSAFADLYTNELLFERFFSALSAEELFSIEVNKIDRFIDRYQNRLSDISNERDGYKHRFTPSAFVRKMQRLPMKERIALVKGRKILITGWDKNNRNDPTVFRVRTLLKKLRNYSSFTDDFAINKLLSDPSASRLLSLLPGILKSEISSAAEKILKRAARSSVRYTSGKESVVISDSFRPVASSTFIGTDGRVGVNEPSRQHALERFSQNKRLQRKMLSAASRIAFAQNLINVGTSCFSAAASTTGCISASVVQGGFLAVGRPAEKALQEAYFLFSVAPSADAKVTQLKKVFVGNLPGKKGFLSGFDLNVMSKQALAARVNGMSEKGIMYMVRRLPAENLASLFKIPYRRIMASKLQHMFTNQGVEASQTFLRVKIEKRFRDTLASLSEKDFDAIVNAAETKGMHRSFDKEDSFLSSYQKFKEGIANEESTSVLREFAELINENELLTAAKGVAETLGKLLAELCSFYEPKSDSILLQTRVNSFVGKDTRIQGVDMDTIFAEQAEFMVAHMSDEALANSALAEISENDIVALVKGLPEEEIATLVRAVTSTRVQRMLGHLAGGAPLLVFDVVYEGIAIAHLVDCLRNEACQGREKRDAFFDVGLTTAFGTSSVYFLVAGTSIWGAALGTGALIALERTYKGVSKIIDYHSKYHTTHSEEWSIFWRTVAFRGDADDVMCVKNEQEYVDFLSKQLWESILKNNSAVVAAVTGLGDFSIRRYGKNPQKKLTRKAVGKFVFDGSEHVSIESGLCTPSENERRGSTKFSCEDIPEPQALPAYAVINMNRSDADSSKLARIVPAVPVDDAKMLCLPTANDRIEPKSVSDEKDVVYCNKLDGSGKIYDTENLYSSNTDAVHYCSNAFALAKAAEIAYPNKTKEIIYNLGLVNTGTVTGSHDFSNQFLINNGQFLISGGHNTTNRFYLHNETFSGKIIGGDGKEAVNILNLQNLAVPLLAYNVTEAGQIAVFLASNAATPQFTAQKINEIIGRPEWRDKIDCNVDDKLVVISRGSNATDDQADQLINCKIGLISPGTRVTGGEGAYHYTIDDTIAGNNTQSSSIKVEGHGTLTFFNATLLMDCCDMIYFSSNNSLSIKVPLAAANNKTWLLQLENYLQYNGPSFIFINRHKSIGHIVPMITQSNADQMIKSFMFFASLPGNVTEIVETYEKNYHWRDDYAVLASIADAKKNRYLLDGPRSGVLALSDQSIQFARGGNGSDLYIFAGNSFTAKREAVIDNYATDKKLDWVFIEGSVNDWKPVEINNDLVLQGNLTSLRIKNYFAGVEYQHLVFRVTERDYMPYCVGDNNIALMPCYVMDYFLRAFSDRLSSGNNYYVQKNDKTIIVGGSEDSIEANRKGDDLVLLDKNSKASFAEKLIIPAFYTDKKRWETLNIILWKEGDCKTKLNLLAKAPSIEMSEASASVKVYTFHFVPKQTTFTILHNQNSRGTLPDDEQKQAVLILNEVNPEQIKDIVFVGTDLLLQLQKDSKDENRYQIIVKAWADSELHRISSIEFILANSHISIKTPKYLHEIDDVSSIKKVVQCACLASIAGEKLAKLDETIVDTLRYLLSLTKRERDYDTDLLLGFDSIDEQQHFLAGFKYRFNALTLSQYEPFAEAIVWSFVKAYSVDFDQESDLHSMFAPMIGESIVNTTLEELKIKSASEIESALTRRAVKQEVKQYLQENKFAAYVSNGRLREELKPQTDFLRQELTTSAWFTKLSVYLSSTAGFGMVAVVGYYLRRLANPWRQDPLPPVAEAISLLALPLALQSMPTQAVSQAEHHFNGYAEDPAMATDKRVESQFFSRSAYENAENSHGSTNNSANTAVSNVNAGNVYFFRLVANTLGFKEAAKRMCKAERMSTRSNDNVTPFFSPSASSFNASRMDANPTPALLARL